jgi:hypothetical protein
VCPAGRRHRRRRPRASGGGLFAEPGNLAFGVVVGPRLGSRPLATVNCLGELILPWVQFTHHPRASQRAAPRTGVWRRRMDRERRNFCLLVADVRTCSAELVLNFLSFLCYSAAAAGAGVGPSEFHMSATTFHVPSGCFFETVIHLPRSATGLPSASSIVSS